MKARLPCAKAVFDTRGRIAYSKIVRSIFERLNIAALRIPVAKPGVHRFARAKAAVRAGSSVGWMHATTTPRVDNQVFQRSFAMKIRAIEGCIFINAHCDSPVAAPTSGKQNRIRRHAIVFALLCIVLTGLANAQVNGEGDRPYLGWSSYSQQTLNGSFLTQANITAQADAMLSSGLVAHGFRYINIDSGWMGSFDGNGRPIPNTTTFPDIAALVAHIHANGEKAGIYWIPGVEGAEIGRAHV